MNRDALQYALDVYDIGKSDRPSVRYVQYD